jgi:hypothetical protein
MPVPLPHNKKSDRDPPLIEGSVEYAYGIPYRGDVDHGMEQRYDYEDVLSEDEVTEQNTAIVVHDIQEPTPVPVKIVSEGASESRRWSTQFVMADSNPKLMLSRRTDRITARIKNVGNVQVLLAPANALSVATAYPLAPGEEFSTNAEAEVWGIAQAASGAGGWINLVPSQVLNAATTAQGSVVSVKGYTMARLMLKTTAVAGTTPTIIGQLFGIQPDGTTNISGAVLGATGALTTISQNTAVVNPLIENNVRGLLNTTGASGDSVITAELWGYFMPDTTSTDTQALLRVYQEMSVAE